MMRRYLSVDDQPETGGQIEPYSGPTISFYGHSPAKIGARCYCNVCKSTGVIAKAGGPRRHIHHGGELALDGDVLLCACPKPPRMVAGAIATAWFEDMGGGQGQQADHAVVSAAASAALFDERIQAVGKGAAEGYPYLIETADGRTFTGRLGSDGCLPRVYTPDGEDYHVYWGDDALSKQAGA